MWMLGVSCRLGIYLKVVGNLFEGGWQWREEGGWLLSGFYTPAT